MSSGVSLSNEYMEVSSGGVSPASAKVHTALRIAFVDFYPGFDEEDNFIIRSLRRHCKVLVDNQAPELVFYSCFGMRHLRYDQCLRVFFSAENVAPDFNICDFAITSCRLEYGQRHLFLPLCLVAAADGGFEPLPPLSIELAHRKFCSFVYSNANVGEGSRLRRDFCQKLAAYSQVDCPGRVLHNMDAPELAARGDEANWHRSKVRFLGGYKFNIAFENSSAPGYMTEKLMDAFLAGTVPIYWGSEGDVSPFPREAMLVASDYDSLDDLVARVQQLNDDDEQYMRMLAANPLRTGMLQDAGDTLAAFLLPHAHRHPFEKDPYQLALHVQLMGMSEAGRLGLRLLQLLAAFRWLFAGNERRPRLKQHYRNIKSMLRDMV